MAAYKFVVVGVAGCSGSPSYTGALAVIDAATLSDVEWIANGHGGGRLAAPATSAVASLVSLDATTWNELQVYRDGVLLAWLIPVRARLIKGVWDIEFAGVSWWFEKRNIGKADRTDEVLNPSFEVDLASWTAANCTATRDTAKHVVGVASVRLDTHTDVDAHFHQQFASAPNGVGVLWTAVAWVWLDGASFVDQALNGRGLYMERIATGDVVVDLSYVKLTGYTPRNQWVRLQTTIWVPPNQTETIDVRLYCPNGIVWWDEVNVVAMESVSQMNTEQANIINAIVLAAQDTATDKDDLNIACSHPATGVKRDRVYQYAEHANCWQSITEMVQLFDGPDVAMVVTPTTRSLHVISPRRSTIAATHTLRLGPTPGTGVARANEILNYEPYIDFGQAANSIVVLGLQTTGPDREEGGYRIPTALGGKAVEEVISAPPESKIDALDNYARREAHYRSTPLALTVQVVKTADCDLLTDLVAGTFMAGDLVAVDINDTTTGVVYTGTLSAESIRLDPTTEIFTLTLNNPVPAP